MIIGMSLINIIDQDLKEALKARDELKLSTLRMLKTAIKNKAIAEKKADLDDQAVIGIVKKEIKKRQDSIGAFRAAGRNELADKEQSEADILSVYAPKMMAETELSAIIDKVIAGGEKNFGLIMKAVMSQAQGQADGQTVQKLVKAKLQL